MAAECEAAVTKAEGCSLFVIIRKFRQLLSVAQQAGCTREDALFDVGLAWTQMQRIALELGHHLEQKCVIAQPGDVFLAVLG